MTLWPKQRTCALLLRTDLSTEYASCAVTALMPLTLFADMVTPRPVPQMRSARSA
jgi:hypothetical protein